MEFDKSKIYTLANADEINVGNKGYFADSLERLKEVVKKECNANYGEIGDIKNESYISRFCRKDSYNYALFYLVEEPKLFRPYQNTDEMIDHFCRHFNLIPQDHRLPTLWVKADDKKYLITRVSEDTVTLCFENEVCTFDLDILANIYTWLDGSPCGIKED